MKPTKPSLQQQRDLLQLEADVLRLKLAAAQMRHRRQVAVKKHDWQHTAWSLLEHIPTGGLALKAVSLPRRWRHKLLLGSIMVGLAWLRQQQK